MVDTTMKITYNSSSSQSSFKSQWKASKLPDPKTYNVPTVVAMRDQWLRVCGCNRNLTCNCRALVAVFSLSIPHMWSHANHLDFDQKKDLYASCHNNMDAKAVHIVPIVVAMKAAGEKDCTLYMAEQTDAYNGFKMQKGKYSLFSSCDRC